MTHYMNLLISFSFTYPSITQVSYVLYHINKLSQQLQSNHVPCRADIHVAAKQMLKRLSKPREFARSLLNMTQQTLLIAAYSTLVSQVTFSGCSFLLRLLHLYTIMPDQLPDASIDELNILGISLFCKSQSNWVLMYKIVLRVACAHVGAAVVRSQQSQTMRQDTQVAPCPAPSLRYSSPSPSWLTWFPRACLASES